MKHIFTIAISAFLMIAATVIRTQAQATEKPTEKFTVTGKVTTPQTITISDLKNYKTHLLGDVTITNHKGDTKGTAKKISGVLLKDVLEGIPLDADNPKVLSAYYFICRATDGYTIVYSWNELFNTSTGNSTFIVTSKDSKTITELDERILMISAEDIRTGRRYLKNLESIYVGRAE